MVLQYNLVCLVLKLYLFPHQEADKLTTALRDEGFRKLLMEYAQEMSDPANKKVFDVQYTPLLISCSSVIL